MFARSNRDDAKVRWKVQIAEIIIIIMMIIIMIIFTCLLGELRLAQLVIAVREAQTDGGGAQRVQLECLPVALNRFLETSYQY